MREFSVPATASVPPTANLTGAVWRNAREHPDAVVFRRRSPSGWVRVTAAEFATEVSAVAAGLVASGVRPGDRVALMSRTRYEWTLCDYAIWAAGGVTVPIYETSSAEQVGWILQDSGAVGVIVETATHARLAAGARDELPDLRVVWQLDAGGVEELRAAGRDVPETELNARQAALTPDSLATVIYTSGTTGRPKGCELTHGNLLFIIAELITPLSALFNERESTLLFLPLAHVFARLIQVGCVESRACMGHTADLKNLPAELAEFAPTFLLAVPRVFEKVYNGAKAKAHDAGKGKIFDRAAATAISYSEALDRGRVPLRLRVTHAAFDRLVYAKLIDALGGSIRYAVSGGAPLGARLGHFFRGVGLVVLEGYGLTETTAGAAINFPDQVRIGTVGRPCPGTTARIADDGELLLAGGHIFRGYSNNPTATAEALEPSGWLHTGDLGAIDDDGFVTIIGRKKEILVTSGGKNVAPALLEDRLRAHPLISQCMVVGDSRPFVACLVTLDPDALPTWNKAHGKPGSATAADLRDDPGLRAELQASIDETNTAVSQAEAIRSFRILPVDFTEEGGELTPSLKLKRAVVAERFADDIDALYAEPTRTGSPTDGKSS